MSGVSGASGGWPPLVSRRSLARAPQPSRGRPWRSEGVLGPREGAALHVVGVGAGGVEEDAVQVGVLLDERGHPAGAQAERVLPDEHLAVGLVAGPDADGGDAELAGHLAGDV